MVMPADSKAKGTGLSRVLGGGSGGGQSARFRAAPGLTANVGRVPEAAGLGDGDGQVTSLSSTGLVMAESCRGDAQEQMTWVWSGLQPGRKIPGQ